MSISYEPLWKTLQQKEINMTEMRKHTGIATATMAKLKKNESLTLAMIDKICQGLHCNIEDVVKIIPDKESPTSLADLLQVSAMVSVSSDNPRHRYGVVIAIIAPGRGIPTYYVLLPLFNSTSKMVVGDDPDKYITLSPKVVNDTSFIPCVQYCDEFSVTEKEITDVAGYISEEDRDLIESVLYNEYGNELQESYQKELL